MLTIAWSPVFHHELPVGHRFPMEKYTLLREQLVYEGTVKEDAFFAPDLLSDEEVLRTHDAKYWDKLSRLQLTYHEARKTGFPQSVALINRELCIMKGTLQCARNAIKYGVSMNIAGGTHHAFTDRGEGFCLLNDLAIAANELIYDGSISKCLIVDLDVHQGNGTAQIFQDNPRVFTFSMHGGANYPMHKEMSDLDVALPDGCDDDQYLGLLKQHLPYVIDQVQPDLMLFQSGVDVLKTDKLGRLGMTITGCKERDRIVLDLAKRHKIPVAIAMGGGYSERISDIVEAHANTFRLAQELYF